MKANSEREEHERGARAHINTNENGREISHAPFRFTQRFQTLGDRNLRLVRVSTFVSGSIHGSGDVEITVSGLNRAVGKGGVGIHGVDLGVRPTRSVTTIDVVADYRG
jgi:hypothetical protein